MTSTCAPPEARYGRITVHRPLRRRRGRRLVALAAVVSALVGLAAFAGYRYVTDDSRRDYLAAGGWPAAGQAAIVVGDSAPQVGPRQSPAPIASVAKVMTAYLVLRDHPLAPGEDGFRMRITEADVRRTEVQRGQDQSLVDVRAGQTLTERQALLALLLPSANNVAEFLARRAAGSVPRFVSWMNVAARAMRMTSTHYADPSGFDPATVSTAADQLRLAQVVARDRTFGELVATRLARLPVAGLVRNTDALLGRDGFVGTKTGSMDAAGGCFMFRARRTLGGRTVDVIGVVLGQPGHNLIDAGLYAAKQLVERVTARSGTPPTLR